MFRLPTGNLLRTIPFLWPALLAMLLFAFSCAENKAGGILRVGLSQEPRTLNIWLASDANSSKVLSLIYQPLYVTDPNTLEHVPWLAEKDPEFDAETCSYAIKLRPAKWSDGTEVTSADVAFTGNLIKQFRVPRYISRWDFVKKIETPDPRTVRLYLGKPKAVFLTRTLSTPIVSRKEWAGIAEAARIREKPLAELLNHKIERPLGTGPFVLREWREGAYLHLQKNEHFFGRGMDVNGRVLGPFIDDMVFKIYGTTDVAVLALEKGSIDFLWWGIQPGYLKGFRQNRDIQIFFSERSALYFMGFNLRRPPFSDPALRKAAAVLIDKDFLISRILQGFGSRMNSIVPQANRFWYCPDVPEYGTGMRREERIRAAHEVLSRAGYTWDVPPLDDAGKVVAAHGIRLPGGQPMESFAILTPPADYDPHRAMSGMMIQEWFRAMGMPAYARPMPFASLLQQIKARHEFDAFIMGYGRLSLDPDYLRNFFHSKNDKPRGWNMSGYRNPVFDRIADESQSAMVPEERRKLIWEMQKIVLGDLPYLPLYKPSLTEAVRRGKFTGWVEMLEGIGNIWSFCQVTAA